MTRTITGPQADHTVELPIFREMEAVWFRSHGSLELGHITRPEPVGRDPHRSTQASPPAPGTGRSSAATGTAGAAGDSHEDWRTAADVGWSAAARASEPPVGGATRSGLPKRVPQAQLVPGGVEAGSGVPATTQQRRSPDEVRGLLAAYHRGVQRGREHWGR
jgi:hypothetical protein